MSIGMTYEQYWYGDVWMVRAFLEAERLRKKRQRDEINFTAYLQGMYIYDAISSLFPIPIAFAPKNFKRRDYAEKPYSLVSGEEKKTEVDQEEINKKKAQVRGLQAKLFASP